MKIRLATEEDLDPIYQLELTSFSIPWSYESLKMEICENILARYFVLEKGNEVIGYGGFIKVLDEAHITNIAIKKEYRGIGCGKILMNGIIDYCRENEIVAITLEVDAKNTAGIRLYNSVGFVEEGRRKNYYGRGKDGLIMWNREI